MKQATLNALKGSIRKWEDIVAGVGEDNGARNCPLCARFKPDCERRDGEICPVRKNAGFFDCAETPYIDWCIAQDARDHGPDFMSIDGKATDDETVMCAVLELEFLKSLLPRGEK